MIDNFKIICTIPEVEKIRYIGASPCLLDLFMTGSIFLSLNGKALPNLRKEFNAGDSFLKEMTSISREAKIKMADLPPLELFPFALI